MNRRVILLAAAMGLLARPAQAMEARYDCADGTRMTVTFTPPEVTPGSATLVIDGASGQIELPQAMSADGGRYAKGDTEFWIKGNEGTFTRSGSSTTCRTN